jgi:outer membrane receptor protein involved in Fe transport
VSASLDWATRRDLSLSMSGGVFTSGALTKNAYTGYRRVFGTSNIGLADVPAELQHAAGYADNPRPTVTLQDDFSRWVFEAKATTMRRWRGEHTLMGGLQFERLANVYDVGEQSPTVTLFWDRVAFNEAGEPVRGPYGFYRVSQLYRSGDVSDSSVGLFIQDSWRIADRLTIDAGIRADRESIPSYRSGNPGLSFGFGDKLAPRLGFAWDPSGRGALRVYGGWGMFLDMTKLTLPRSYFGAIRWDLSLMTLGTPNWPEIECAAVAVPGPTCPGTLIQHQDRALAPNRPDSQGRPVAADPDLRPFRTQELTLGVDRQLGDRIIVGARYVRKWLDRALEDTLVRTVDPEEQFLETGLAYRIVNPGYGLAHRPLGEEFRPMPKAQRTYDALELRVDRRFADRWSLTGSYTFSSLRGNYSGLIDTDVDPGLGIAAPNVEPSLDHMRLLFDATGREVFGRLATDRPHVAKLQGTVDVPGGTIVGANAFLASGTPLQRYVLDNLTVSPIYYRNRGSDGRTPAVSAMDLLIQHRFRMGPRRTLEIEATALNVFDQSTAVSYWMSRLLLNDALFFYPLANEQLLSGWDPEAIAEESGFEVDPQFGMADFFQDRRSFRLAIRFRF